MLVSAAWFLHIWLTIRPYDNDNNDHEDEDEDDEYDNPPNPRVASKVLLSAAKNAYKCAF